MKLKINTDLSDVKSLLDELLTTQSKDQIANALSVDIRTVQNWITGKTTPAINSKNRLRDLLNTQKSTYQSFKKFRFIDLFAGIGGFRLAFEQIGGQCVFTSEMDKYAQKTYIENFSIEDHLFNEDITKIEVKNIPDHEVLLAGFPCQPFSIAGVTKKKSLGRSHGFADNTQGTLFFDIARIIEEKRPKAFLLENVKNLKSHNNGHTFDIILKTLSEELGYFIHHKIIDGAHFTPQHRERILIVGFSKKVSFDWEAISLPPKGEKKLGNILHKLDGTEPYLPWDEDRFFNHSKKIVQPNYTLSPKLWQYLQDYATKHREKGNGFGYGLARHDTVSRTLSARYYKDGSEILIEQSRKKNPRRLTPRECARLMGFDDKFQIPVSDTRAYKQFGNSVVVDVILHAAQLMRKFI
jgi:DNA (cytosine-5)-methyltransferase 1